MKKEIKDKAASVKARLLNISTKTNVDFDALLLLYLQERFLYHLAISQFSGNFILKGGLLLFCLNVIWSRPTKDIDFLAQGVKNTASALEGIFKNIAGLECDDGVNFDLSSIYSERIIENTEYVGIRLKIKTYLGKAWKVLQFDVGFGDTLWPKPDLIEFPGLLEDPKPLLHAYSVESIIAEKFEIMLKKEMMNGRMKDFFDIYNLSFSYNFSGKILKKAIENTLRKRQTVLNDIPFIFREEFQKNRGKKLQWAAFLRKTRISQSDQDFSGIMNRIIDFLKPLVVSIKENKEMEQSWDPKEGIWK